MSAPTAGLAQRFLALRSRRARSRPAARGARRPREEAGGRSRRGGGGRGVGDPEAPVPGNLGGPGAAPGGSPRHNLPRTHRPHPAPWKKEPAHRFPLGCSSASAGPPAPGHPWNLRPQPCPRPPAAPGARPGARGWGESKSGMRQACREGRSISVPRSRGLLRLFRRSEPRRCRPRGACLPQSSLPVCLAFRGRRRGTTGGRVPGPLSLWIRRVGPAVRPGRETLHPASGPAEAWGPEGMGKRSPFFPVPAILRFRFSLGASVANHAALGARLVAGSGGERLGGPRTSSPEYRGSARRDPHLNFQALEPRARVNSPKCQRHRKYEGQGPGLTFYLSKRLIRIILYPRVLLANS